MPSPRGEVFHFIFHFHYLSGASINARRIREITWALAFPGLVLILLSARLSPSVLFFIRCSSTVFALLSLFTHHLSHSNVLFPLLCLSLSISGCHSYSVAFSPLSSVTYSFFSISPTRIFVFNHATTASSLFSWACRSLHTAGTPEGAHTGSAWLGPALMGPSGRPVLSKKKYLKKGPPNP